MTHSTISIWSRDRHNRKYGSSLAAIVFVIGQASIPNAVRRYGSTFDILSLGLWTHSSQLHRTGRNRQLTPINFAAPPAGRVLETPSPFGSTADRPFTLKTTAVSTRNSITVSAKRFGGRGAAIAKRRPRSIVLPSHPKNYRKIVSY